MRRRFVGIRRWLEMGGCSVLWPITLPIQYQRAFWWLGVGLCSCYYGANR